MKRVLIFGTGALAECVHACLEETGAFEAAAFTVDAAFVRGTEFRGLPVVPFEEAPRRFPPEGFGVLIAAGYRGVNLLRREKHRAAKALGYALPRLVHPSSPIPPTVSVGEGSLILEGNRFQPFSRVGAGVVLWTGNVVGHHAVLGDHGFVTSGVAVGGRTTVGESCFLGPGAVLRDGICVGEGCVVGAGAVLLRDAAPGGVYAVRSTERSRVPSHRLRGL